MQCSTSILLIKPANFSYNNQTACSNVFQVAMEEDISSTNNHAVLEFDRMVELLTYKGVNVLVIPDTKFPIKPDAIFPNNWITFHTDGTVVLYPMLAQNRRLERRKDILETIKEKFECKKLLDLTSFEKSGVFLEGTGSIIFNHVNKKAYACLSPRTDKKLFIKTCKLLNYKPYFFTATDAQGKEIYHTNVIMSIGNGYSVICLESIKNTAEKELIIESLKESNHKIIDISYDQMNSFCGNILELELMGQKNILALSKRAFDSFTTTQKIDLQEYCELFPINIDTIEQVGGGSVRCMIAELFLPLK